MRLVAAIADGTDALVAAVAAVSEGAYADALDATDVAVDDPAHLETVVLTQPVAYDETALRTALQVCALYYPDPPFVPLPRSLMS